jgi:hypothetical protein
VSIYLHNGRKNLPQFPDDSVLCTLPNSAAANGVNIAEEAIEAVGATGLPEMFLLRAKAPFRDADDPPPGNTVMWRGLARLTDIEIGFDLAKGELVGN